MGRAGLEGFFKAVAESREGLDKVKSFGGDMEALAAYAKELGYDVSPEALREHQANSLKLIKGRVKKSKETKAAVRPGMKDFYALLELAEADPEVAKRLEELGIATREELIAYGKEKGFVFDEQDLEAVGSDILEPEDELSEEELELVAGGTTLLAIGVGAGILLIVVGVAAVAAALVR